MAQIAIDELMKELRFALEDGLGKVADSFTLIHMDQLTGPDGAGVRLLHIERLLKNFAAGCRQQIWITLPLRGRTETSLSSRIATTAQPHRKTP